MSSDGVEDGKFISIKCLMLLDPTLKLQLTGSSFLGTV